VYRYAEADMYEQKYQAAMKTVNALKDGIWKIYNKIGCNTPANRELLGGVIRADCRWRLCIPGCE
jgi:hypothetical protein